MPNSGNADFVLESREHLQLFERSMLAVEKATGVDVGKCIDDGFRAVHSLKGNAGFLGFHAVQRLSHATESVLERYRGGSQVPSVQVVETLLLASDRISVMIEDLPHSDSQDISTLMERLSAIESHDSLSASFHLSVPLAREQPSVLPLLQCICNLGKVMKTEFSDVDFTKAVFDWKLPIQMKCELVTQQSLFEVKQALDSTGNSISWSEMGGTELSELDVKGFAESWIAKRAGRSGELHYEPRDFSAGVPRPPIVWLSSSCQPTQSHSSVQPPLPVAEPPSQLTEPLLPLAEPPPPLAEPTEGRLATGQNPTLTRYAEQGVAEQGVVSDNIPSRGQADTTVASDRVSSLRIQVDLLDRLMNLVGELTLVRNQTLLAFGETDGNPRAIIQRLDSVTSELQETVLKTRMQPVGNLFGRFPRLVRDLARQLGKQVELVTVGQEVELDKTVLEQLSDPLTHLIRNSADHGLELPEVRQKAGKPAIGKITLSAMAADGQVIIEIRDDGRGIDPNAVRAKLISLGIKTETELHRISSKELYSAILLPGFSTAKQVSDVSGRGVGMDVVKTNIERLEGTLTIDSTPGLGTSIVMRVPLTLAIIPCLIVMVDGERFVVPQRGLEEIVCLYPGGPSAIERSYDTELFRLRDLLIPVVRFSEVLKRKSIFQTTTKTDIINRNASANRDPSCVEYILVLRTNGRKFGVLVDEVRGTEEIVVKPMHPSLKKIGIFAGATLMGDGKVALIANIDGIAEHADCHGTEPPKSIDKQMRDPAEVHRILLFEYGPGEQFALPLVQVRRIESISMDQIETVGQKAFITIDGKAIRIVCLDKYLNVSACEASPNMHLLLPKFVQEPIGILVSRIVDTESMAIDLQEAGVEDPGILGTAIVRGKLSLFLDIQFLREQLFGVSVHAELPARARALSVGSNQPTHPKRTPQNFATTNRHVLLVDDTPFFREVVKRYFERIGLTVTTAVDGIDGLLKLESESFDLVVSDVEMPNMNGWDFCKAARERGCQTPFLALTSLNKLENSAKASEFGFDMFEEKLDHDRLVGTVRMLLGIQTEGQT